MKRDMELMRKILITIEEKYEAGWGSLPYPAIDGYDMKTVAEHCDLLFQQGLIKEYQPSYADDGIVAFYVGNLTAQGYDYLELIKNNEVWDKTKAEIEGRRLPNTVETITRVAAVFMANFFKELNS